MNIKLAATCLLIGTALVPMTGYAADTDTDRASVKDFVKDSLITTKIKAKLAEAKLSSTVHIKVDTENKGNVQLSGTAKSQADVDRAGAIAKGVEGVAAVENNIQVGKGRAHRHADKASSGERVEARIADMHSRLQVTAAQEEQWAKVAQVMRDNAQQMDRLTKTRAEKADMNAIEDLDSYGEITEAHAEGIKRFTASFKTLYDTMSATQKSNADAIFRHRGRKAS